MANLSLEQRELLEKAVARHVDKMDMETLVYLVECDIYYRLLESDAQDREDFIAEELD